MHMYIQESVHMRPEIKSTQTETLSCRERNNSFLGFLSLPFINHLSPFLYLRILRVYLSHGIRGNYDCSFEAKRNKLFSGVLRLKWPSKNCKQATKYFSSLKR